MNLIKKLIPILIIFLSVVDNVIYSQEWIKITPQFNPQGNYLLYHIAIADKNNCWFVDYNSGRIFHSNNGGYDWIMQRDSIIMPQPRYRDIFFADSLNGWVLTASIDSSFILRTTDSGNSWQKIYVPYFMKFYFTSSENGVAAGPDGIFYTQDGGINWNKSNYNEAEIENGIVGVSKVAFFDDLIGCLAIQPGISWEGYTILLTSQNGGINWQIQNTNIGNEIITEIFYLDSLQVYACMGIGSLWFSNDGCLTWENKSLEGFYSVVFVNDSLGYGAGGMSSDILKTTNKGYNWELIESYYNPYSTFHYKKNSGVIYLIGLDSVLYRNDMVVNIEDKDNNYLYDGFELYQNYPNPFNPSSKIRFEIRKANNYSLKIYDILGKEVRLLFNRYFQPGSYEMNFDGDGLTSGIYFCVMQAIESKQIIKLILMH